MTADGKKCSMRGWALWNVGSSADARSLFFRSSAVHDVFVRTSWNQSRKWRHQGGTWQELPLEISFRLWVDCPLPIMRIFSLRSWFSISPKCRCSFMSSPFFSDSWNTEISRNIHQIILILLGQGKVKVRSNQGRFHKRFQSRWKKCHQSTLL